MDITQELIQDLKKSSLRVYSWNPKDLTLCIALEDQEFMHIGVLCLDDVSHFCMPSELKVEQLEISPVLDLPEDFWCSVSIRKQDFAKDQSFVIFRGTEGERFFVAAKDMKYSREDQ